MNLEKYIQIDFCVNHEILDGGFHKKIDIKRKNRPHIKLREVKQLKETAVCESMYGGVRGRGSNPPTNSISLYKI